MRRVAVSWRDDGVLALTWQLVWLLLIGGQPNDFPPPRHVGRVSGSFPDTGRLHLALGSTRIYRLPHKAATSRARLWRLICVWGTRQPLLPLPLSGELWGVDGKRWAAGGVVDSRRQTGTILTSHERRAQK